MKNMSFLRAGGLVAAGFAAAFLVRYQGYISSHPLPADKVTPAMVRANLQQGALVSLYEGFLGALLVLSGGFVNLDKGEPLVGRKK